MVHMECGDTIDYILYEMEWHVFLEMYNWLLMYKHGHKRTFIKKEDKGEGMTFKKVYDEANMNWIDYMESEEHRYTWMEDKHCFYLKIGD